MKKEEHIGFRVDEVGKLMRRAMRRGCIDEGMDPVLIHRGWIIGYLRHAGEIGESVCQKDLECIFHFPKSTITDTVQLFEKNGLVTRVSVENDARRKQVVLTEEGIAYAKKFEDQIDLVEKYVRNGITPEELDIFFGVLEKLRANAEEYKKEIND